MKGQVDIIAGEECVLEDVAIAEDMGMLHYSVVAERDSGLILQSITAENRTGTNEWQTKGRREERAHG